MIKRRGDELGVVSGFTPDRCLVTGFHFRRGGRHNNMEPEMEDKTLELMVSLIRITQIQARP